MKQVVVMGGANGPSLVLRGLRQFPDEYALTAIISMSDSGRSAGKVRQELGQLPPADILRVLLALSAYDYKTMMKLLYTERFETPEKLAGLNIGSALIALLSQYTGDPLAVVQELSRLLACQGTVLPATLTLTDLVVECANGEVIRGEGNIDEPAAGCDSPIVSAYLDPPGALLPAAHDAIVAADYIIIGPGDLYTSNIAALLATGTRDAIHQSAARLIYVAENKYTIGGEPAPQTLSARVRALETYLPRAVDAIIFDSHKLSAAEQAHYAKKRWGLVTYDVNRLPDAEVLLHDIELPGGGLDPLKIGHAIHSFIHSL